MSTPTLSLQHRYILRERTNVLGGPLGSVTSDIEGRQATSNKRKLTKTKRPNQRGKVAPYPAEKGRHIGSPATITGKQAIGLKAHVKNIDVNDLKARWQAGTPTFNSDAIQSFDLSAITRHQVGAANASDAFRKSDKVYIKSVRLTLWGLNLSPDITSWHVAIVSPRNQTDHTNATDFFESEGGVLSKTYSNALTSIEIDTLNINKNMYDVYFHSKYTLGTKGNTQGTTTIDTPEFYRGSHGYPVQKQIEIVVPIDKFIEYESAAQTTATNSLNLLMWCKPVLKPANDTMLSNMTVQFFVETHYKDVFDN